MRKLFVPIIVLIILTVAALFFWPKVASHTPAERKPENPFSEVCGVYFGTKWGGDLKLINALPGGKFFSTSDYGYTPGEEYTLTAKKFGLTVDGAVHLVGQNPGLNVAWNCSGWLSAGGSTLCGLEFEKTEHPSNRAVVYWGEFPPKPGTWGAAIRDAGGKLIKVPVDDKKAIYPFDQTTIDFPAADVKTFYLGFKGGKDGAKDQFVSVERIDLHRAEKETLANKPLVWQGDSYLAGYDSEKPGTLVGLQILNYFFPWGVGYEAGRCALTDLAPFLQVGDKRISAAQGDYPISVEKDGRTLTLRYTLRFALPDGGEVQVPATAVYGVDLKDTIRFQFQAKNLPEGAKLGFEMKGAPHLFGKAVFPVMEIGSGLNLATPAGPFGIRAKGAKQMTATTGDPIRFAFLADGPDLEVVLAPPIGPKGGIQPDMVKYTWYPSKARQGDEGVAPFRMEDLELIETVDLSDPNSPYEVYDLTNDPIILNWRKSGNKSLPQQYGAMKYINEPDKVKVPLGTVLGENCREISNLDTCYFRVNLKKTHLEPHVPYLIVVEHAFDKDRFGEFHAIALDPSGLNIVDNNLWHGPNPLGGVSTGEPPYEGKFKKEPTLFYHSKPVPYGKDTMLSLCFSNRVGIGDRSDAERPYGPAVKSVSIYRVKNMPELPDLKGLLPPEGQRRHITMGTESSGSPWEVSQYSRLAGYDFLFSNHQMPNQFLHRTTYEISRPGFMSSWHGATLEAQKWLFQKAEENQISCKILTQTLLACGFEGTDHCSFEAASGTSGGYSVPLSPTPEEKELLKGAFSKSLAALAPYKSFENITVMTNPRYLFSKRNLDDFSRETGISFASSPVDLQNLQTLMDSGKESVEAWSRWSSQKRFEYYDWVIKLARSYKPDIYLTLNQPWEGNLFQIAYHSASTKQAAPYVYFDPAKLKALGIDTYADFLRLIAHDPALYANSDGITFGLERARIRNHSDHWIWPSPYKDKGFETIRDGFGGGISVSLPFYEEGPKPLKGWSCNYVRDQRGYRRDLVEGLLYANARDFFIDTFYQFPFTSRLADTRDFAIPFRLLPSVKPGEYEGKISDTAGQAVIRKYGDRYGLMNAGPLASSITLVLPKGKQSVTDLSNGIRQELPISTNSSGERQVTIAMDQWSLNTLEIN